VFGRDTDELVRREKILQDEALCVSLSRHLRPYEIRSSCYASHGRLMFDTLAY